MEYWIVFRSSDGAELYRGAAPAAGTAAMQEIPADADFLVVPTAAVAVLPTDLQAIAAFLCAQVDAEAEAKRARFLTIGEGQALTYFAKRQEAEALAKNPQASALILRAEAAALGILVEELAVEIRAAVEKWTAMIAAIEAIRRSSKAAIRAAENLSSMKRAATADWSPVAALSNQ